MRMANQAILRTRYVTPTLDDIIHDLNGAVKYTKLDLVCAFQQLELHPVVSECSEGFVVSSAGVVPQCCTSGKL